MTSKKEEKKININGKPKYINLGTDYNFFELFQKIQLNFVNCFLFESLGEESNISRYHIIGFDPKYIIYSENDYELKINCPTSDKTDTITCDNPYYKLRDIIPQNVISRKYAGGLVGYISYDSITVSYTHLTLPTIYSV